ncbi:MAG: LysM peptidoglycan-binding domain-containing protein [Candidatus Omnitrophica bacterium]|nr:LysM peptidoglycan-binding domain-containing protein [Candidatus Omnitrophota bacterium]
MKKLSLLFAAFLLSGCIMRATPYKMDRVDQEIKGNRGVLVGSAEASQEADKKKTRTMYNIEIELPSRSDVKNPDLGTRGNRGYISKRDVAEQKNAPVKKVKSVAELKPISAPKTAQVVYTTPLSSDKGYIQEKGEGTLIEMEKSLNTYIVENGDTLQKISNKMYGTTKRWKKIYEVNKKVLKSPDKIKPGQKLMIPIY